MFELTEKQKIALYYLTDNEIEFVGYGGGAGGGKTFLGSYWLMQLGYYAPNTKYFIGRDSLKDTRESVLHTWRKLSRTIGFDNYWNYNNNYIKFFNGSEIEFIDLSFLPNKDPMFERFGSKEYTSGWIEEAGGVHPQAFEILKTRVGRWYNDEYNIKKKILSTFNPKKNWVDTTFYRPFQKNEEAIDTKFIFALAKDNPHLPKDYIKTLENLKDEATKQRLLFGNFDYDNDPTSLISYDNINGVFTNNHIEEGHQRYIIGDIARFGSDKAVIFVWYGMVIKEIVVFDKSDMVILQNTINALRRKHNISARNCLVDADGIGGGVVDNLGIIGFTNGGKPFDSIYSNLKNECGYKLADEIDNIFFDAEISEEHKEQISQELAQLKTYDSDKESKLRLLPKEKIKQNIGRSPDFLDVFIMRMYYEVGIITTGMSVTSYGI